MTTDKIDTNDGGSDGLGHVGVGEDDIGRLAAELEADLLEIRIGSGSHNAATSSSRTSEGDFADVRVRGDGMASGGTVARQNVDDARREASLDNELGDAEGVDGCLLRRLKNDNISGSYFKN